MTNINQDPTQEVWIAAPGFASLEVMVNGMGLRCGMCHEPMMIKISSARTEAERDAIIEDHEKKCKGQP